MEDKMNILKTWGGRRNCEGEGSKSRRSITL